MTTIRHPRTLAVVLIGILLLCLVGCGGARAAPANGDGGGGGPVEGAYEFVTKWGSSGSDDGEFAFPEGVAVDAEANVYVADQANYRIQKFRPVAP